MKYIPVLVFSMLLCSGCNFPSEKNTYAKISEEISAKNLNDQDPLKESIERGSFIYQDFCMTCHLPDGKGVEKSFPPLAGSDFLMNKRTESIRAIKYGQNETITVNGVSYTGVMAAMGLENNEVADVMNYIMNSWGNNQIEMVTEEEVEKVAK